MAGKLIIVGTPIGNLSDFSPRAIETLETCDFIAAEDTRVTVKLLNHFGIKKPMVSYFEHNKMERGDIICHRMERVRFVFWYPMQVCRQFLTRENCWLHNVCSGISLYMWFRDQRLLFLHWRFLDFQQEGLRLKAF